MKRGWTWREQWGAFWKSQLSNKAIWEVVSGDHRSQKWQRWQKAFKAAASPCVGTSTLPHSEQQGTSWLYPVGMGLEGPVKEASLQETSCLCQKMWEGREERVSCLKEYKLKGQCLMKFNLFTCFMEYNIWRQKERHQKTVRWLVRQAPRGEGRMNEKQKRPIFFWDWKTGY